MRIPESFPPGCRFFATFSGDEIVEFPDGKFFKVSDDGASMRESGGLPMSGAAPITKEVFLNSVKSSQEFAAKKDSLWE